MKRKVLKVVFILIACGISGFVGWSFGNPDRTGYELTIRALQDRCAALEEIIESDNWTPMAWGLSDGKPLYPIKPSYK